jgi:hypothetical protein
MKKAFPRLCPYYAAAIGQTRNLDLRFGATGSFDLKKNSDFVDFRQLAANSHFISICENNRVIHRQFIIG